MASAPVLASDLRQPSTPGAGGFGSTTLFRNPLTVTEVVWLVFVTVQALDGVMSYIGVSVHGPGIEANPLVGWYMGVFGPALGFMIAKLFAVTCGGVLYVTARHRWVAALTLLYVVFAVGPWTQLLINGA